MKSTIHEQMRAQQRGISKESVDLILAHGSPVRRPGGVVEYRLTRKIKAEAIMKLKRQIKKLENANNIGVLVSPGGSLITVYHL